MVEEQGQRLIRRWRVGPLFPEGADLAIAWEDHLFHPLPPPQQGLDTYAQLPRTVASADTCWSC